MNKKLIIIIFTLLCNVIKTMFCITCNFGTVSNGTHCEECGLTDVASNVKIVGGVQAVPNSWPSQAFIVENIDDVFKLPDGSFDYVQTYFLCGGTLINRYTILTAAHCIKFAYSYDYKGDEIELPLKPSFIYPTIESRFMVYLGMHNISNLQLAPKAPAAAFEVSKIIIHPSYDDYVTLQNDIALLILKTPVNYTKFIKPECLPKARDLTYPLPNSDVFVAGWGYTKENGLISNLLLNLKLTVYNSSLCQPVLPESTKNWNSQICAGYLPGGKDTCQGDSGGGLHILDTSLNKTIRVVSGIVSYGNGCARKNSPGIYTRTSFYLDWIYTNWVVDATTQSVTSQITIPTTKVSSTSTNLLTTTTRPNASASSTTSTTIIKITTTSATSVITSVFTTTTTKLFTTSANLLTTTTRPTTSTLKTSTVSSTTVRIILSTIAISNASTLSSTIATTPKTFNIQSFIDLLQLFSSLLDYIKNYF